MKSNKPRGLLVDSPLTIDYDQTTGMVYVSSQAGLSTGAQFDLVLEVTPEAAQELLVAIQVLEKTQDRPPSAHAKPRTRQ